MNFSNFKYTFIETKNRKKITINNLIDDLINDFNQTNQEKHILKEFTNDYLNNMKFIRISNNLFLINDDVFTKFMLENYYHYEDNYKYIISICYVSISLPSFMILDDILSLIECNRHKICINEREYNKIMISKVFETYTDKDKMQEEINKNLIYKSNEDLISLLYRTTLF